MRETSLPMVYGGLVFLLSACATAANGGSAERDAPRGIEQFAGDPRLGEEVSRMCFTSNVDSFSNPTEDTVILRVGPSRDYLVETRGCFILDRAQSIGLDTTTSCASRGDRLIVSESAFGLSRSVGGLGPERCLIDSIYEWDEDAADQGAQDAED